jgi:hypothetical protein
MKRLCRHAQGSSEPVFDFACSDGQDSAAADAVVWAEAEPGSEGGGVGKPTQVRANFGQERMSSQAAYSGNFGQVHSKDAVEMTPQIEVEFIASRLVAVLGLGQRLLIRGGTTGQRLQLTFDLTITSSDLLLILPIRLQRLPESEQMLVTVVCHERASNCFPARCDSSIAQRSQFFRVPLAPENRVDDL